MFEVAMIVSYCILGVFLLISVFLLCRPKKTYDAAVTNKYGVIKETGKDPLFKKLSVISIILPLILAVLSFLTFAVVDANVYADEEYEYYQSDEALDEAQNMRKLANDYSENATEYFSLYLQGYDCLDKYYTANARSTSYANKSTEIYQKADWEKSDFAEDYFDSNFLDSILYIAFLGLGILFPLYMFPLLTARKKEHNQTAAIAWLNFIFGVTIIIWIAMLIWANSANDNKKKESASLTDKIAELKTLNETGALTDEEYQAKKAELLSKFN